MNDEKLTASGCPVLSHVQQRFQQTLHFGDVLTLAYRYIIDYLFESIDSIWPLNIEQSTRKDDCGEDKNHVMRGTFLEWSTDFDNKIL